VSDRRESPRERLDVGCTLTIGARAVLATLVDLSEVGALFRLAPTRGNRVSDEVSDDDLGQDARFLLTTVKPARRYTGEIIRRFYRDGAHYIALRFWDPYEEVGPA
jgi:hypothetical protein